MIDQAAESVGSTTAKDIRRPGPLLVDVMLALVAMAGPLYVDLMPALIATLRAEYGLRPGEAGFVAGVNGYGSMIGALLALVLVSRIPWRASLFGLLAVLTLADLLTMAVRDYPTLLSIRFIHGVAGGLLVGITYALMSQTADPRHSFGVLFVCHFGFGGVGIAMSSLLADKMHSGIVFGILAGFGLIAAALVLLLPRFGQPGAVSAPRPRQKMRFISLPTFLKVAGIFLFQAANLGLGAFLIGIAVDVGQPRAFAGLVVGLGLIAGVPGSLFMIFLSNRLGWWPVAPALLAAGFAKLLVLYGTTASGFALGVAVVYLTMAVALPYVMSACAQADRDGYSAVLGGFASKLGLACGPIAAGFLYVQGSSILVVASAATTVLAAAVFALAFRLQNDRTGAPLESATSSHNSKYPS
jgi:predicted MFS family arabinose efflux permease